MEENKTMSFREKNSFCYTALQATKENIVNLKEPKYNPIVLIGLDKTLRYRIFWSIFNKKINQEHKGTYIYSSSDKIDLDKVQNKKLVIVENIELLNSNKALQNKIKELLMIGFKQKMQIILCSDIDINNLEIEKILKSKMLYGISLYLEK